MTQKNRLTPNNITSLLTSRQQR